MSGPARTGPVGPGADARDDLEAITRDIVTRTIEELRREERLSTFTRTLTQTVLRGLKRRTDYDDVISDLDRITGDLSRISAILNRCSADLRREERRVALGSPGSTVWWNTRRRAVVRAVRKGGSQEAISRWTAVWVEGLATGQWARCRELIELPGLPAAAERTRDWMRAVTDAMDSGRYAAALDPLDGLLDGGAPAGTELQDGTAVRLGVLRTRILAGEFSDREVIRDAAEAAVTRAGTGTWRPLALAALAETQLAAGEIDAARQTLDGAGQPDAAGIDVLVASGLLREREGLWSSADQCYDDAVRRDRAAALRPVLLRPVPARLLVRAAVSPDLPVAEAVHLIERALDQETGKDGGWQHEVQLALAERLLRLAQDDEEGGQLVEALEHRSRAARLLVDAGQGFAWSGLTHRAVGLFDQACQLAPDVAEFHWARAEGLRLDAARLDGTTDLRVLRTAREQLEQGLRLRPPEDAEAWVLITQALIEEQLPDAHHDPALLVERALLKEPESATGYGFLAGILRRQGFVQEAFQASDDGRRTVEPSDPFLFEAHLGLVLDLGRHDEALDLVEYQSLWQPDDNIAWYQADVLLRASRPDDALDALSGQEMTDPVRALRAFCLFGAGDAQGSRDEYWSLWNDTRSGPSRDIAAWAALRAGLLDEAIGIYRQLRDGAPARSDFPRDLGQALLVRGDVAEGTALLAEGISACPFPADLRLLAADEFEFVRYATAQADHAADVAAALADLGEQVDRRCEELLRARRPADAAPALLGAARLAMHAGRPADALAVYAGLVGRADVPEAAAAAMGAGISARDRADVLFAEDDHDEARRQWSTVERGILRMPAGADSALVRSLACRRMLAGLIDGAGDGVAGWLADVSGDPVLESEFTEAARTLAHDVPTLWSLRDGLLGLSGRPDVGGKGSRLALAAAEQLPVARAYHLEAVAAPEALSSRVLLVNPLELRLGPGADELLDSAGLAQATRELQARIEADMGVRIPWVYPVEAPRLPDHQVDVRIYGNRVGSTVLAGPPDGWVAQVLAELEQRVRGYLFRLVGVDDVVLWLEGWDLRTGDAPTWDPTDPRADRLRLARVLRMLLREQVPVTDRHTIVDAVRSPSVDKREESATANTLLDVRRRLGSSALGIGPDTLVLPLPPELEARVAAGLPPDRPVWELPRREAAPLVADLRAWLGGQPGNHRAITVADARVRPFLWRLLAAERPAVRVLSEEELSRGGDPS